MRKLGFQIEPHPTVASTTHHPDFKLTRGPDLCYLEVTAAAPSDEEAAATRRLNRVYDTLDRMESPNFFVAVEIQGKPESDPPGAQIRRFLTRELKKLDPDVVVRDFESGGLDALPKWRFQHGDWEIEFSPMPKRQEGRGKPGLRPIGLEVLAPQNVDCRESIVAALESKAKRYGSWNHPYIVGVNVLHNFVDRVDISEALFGQEVMKVTLLPSGQRRPVLTREPNGAWYGPTGPRCIQMSAALMADNFSYWDIARRAPVVWHHPWSQRPVSDDIWPFGQIIGDTTTGQLRQLDAREKPHRFFELPEMWPATAPVEP
jgi:hypothetical protein